MALPKITNIRDAIKAISPRFLQDGVGEKFMYTCGLALDVLLEKLNEGMQMHMPKYADASALPYIGLDRQISQGVLETAAGYAARLQLAFDDWRYAGSSRAVLRQVIGYLSPSQPRCRTVSPMVVGSSVIGAVWNTYAANTDTSQAPANVTETPTDWNWGTMPNWIGAVQWWQSWVILYATSPNAFAAPSPVWGAGNTWGDASKSWGLSIPQTEVASIRAIVGQWKAAHSQVQWIIISFDDTLFDPALGGDGTHNPDGTWGTWAKITNSPQPTNVASRPANARYCDGVL